MKGQLKKSLAALEFEVGLLEGAIESLSPDLKEVVKGIYFEKKTIREICIKLYISENTLHRRRKKAIAAIAHRISIIF